MHKDTDTAPAPAARPYPRPPGKATQPAHRPYPVRAPTTAPEFPGCRPMPLRHRDLDDYEGRFEYWDRDTEIAWVCEPPSPAHEYPSHGLAALVARISDVRGSPIRCYGTMALELRDERGERWRILQADQSVYLHPGRVELAGSRAMVVGRHNPPDVVLEVDHTTDVRRGKLGLYEEWGFPELWVEVPEGTAASRAAGRRPGLTIYRLEGGVYREAPGSVAFAGWRAEEIHRALNEGRCRRRAARRWIGWAGRWGSGKAPGRTTCPGCAVNAGRRTPRDASRGTPRDMPRGTPRGTPRDASRDVPRDVRVRWRHSRATCWPHGGLATTLSGSTPGTWRASATKRCATR